MAANDEQRQRVQRYIRFLYDRWRDIYPNSAGQGDFAAAAGIHETMLSDYLRGVAVPQATTLLALMDAVGMTEAPDEQRVMDAARAMLRRLETELREREGQ